MTPIELDAISTATKLASDYFESKGIAITNKTLQNIIMKWFTRIESPSPLTLASLAIENPTEVDLSDAQIQKIKERYFS